jgi:sterol desaturase/sphingolipid hydroxylase (fatty acid hydroxylase superfamily)
MSPAPVWFLPENLLVRGIISASLAVLLTIVLELTCRDDVRKLWHSHPEGKRLYQSAIRSNIRNNLFLGPITYYIAIRYFCTTDPTSVIERLHAIAGIVVIEALLYYLLHKACHEIRGLYWIHRFHHQFNTVVLPSSANAVSVTEYVVLYMLPLVVGVAWTRADEIAAFLGAAIVGVSNLLIHTPWLEEWSFHWIFVSAKDHLNHHRRFHGDYGAPVFHMDRIMDRVSQIRETKYS